jgi:hypothetical protein
MEYFLPAEKSYMKHIAGEFPIDHGTWTYTVRGTGDEPQSWTCGRDVARAVVELLSSEEDWVGCFFPESWLVLTATSI